MGASESPDEPSGTSPAEANRVVRRLFTSFMVSRAIYVAASLGIADLLASGPRPVGELAAATHSHARTLHRLLRLLASEGIFQEVRTGTFALTPIGACLQEDAPQSIRSLVLLQGDQAQWRAWEDLPYSVATGAPAFDHVWGQPPFRYYAEHPLGAIFNQAMTQETQRTAAQVAQAYDFSRFHSLVDVGGGQGVQLMAILERYPQVRGTLFDLSEVTRTAESLIATRPVATRCQMVAGDFFVEVPKGADAYLVRRVLRDWPDESAIKILQSCRRAMTTTSTLLIVEPVIAFGNHAMPPERLDLNMQVLFAGIVRTLDEFRDILGTAGFRLVRAIPTPSAGTVIEATPEPGG